MTTPFHAKAEKKATPHCLLDAVPWFAGIIAPQGPNDMGWLAGLRTPRQPSQLAHSSPRAPHATNKINAGLRLLCKTTPPKSTATLPKRKGKKGTYSLLSFYFNKPAFLNFA